MLQNCVCAPYLSLYCHLGMLPSRAALSVGTANGWYLPGRDGRCHASWLGLRLKMIAKYGSGHRHVHLDRVESRRRSHASEPARSAELDSNGIVSTGRAIGSHQE